MPYIEIFDPWGMRYCITSTVESTIKAWFEETLPKVRQEDCPPPRIIVHPMPHRDGELDWPIGNANGYTLFTATTGLQAIAELEDMRSKGPWPYGR